MSTALQKAEPSSVCTVGRVAQPSFGVTHHRLNRFLSNQIGSLDEGDRMRVLLLSIGVYGGETASTWITKLQVHVVMVANHFNPKPQNIVANDESYALAA